MRQSKLFIKIQKEPPKDEESRNAQLLLRAGFIDKLMSGSYTFLPLGHRVLGRIEEIIRQEMNKTGAQEILMPLMHPKNVWDSTGRWDSAKDVMFQLEKGGKEFGLSFTHEEIVMDIMRKRNLSYRDLPLKLYHFSTKFRNELRSRSGLLRGTEFLMKDLYSLHVSERDMKKYYEEVSNAYIAAFKRMGLEVKAVEAAGGVFTDSTTREFQLITQNGEDTVFYCNKCDWAENKEIAKVKKGDQCPKCDGKVEKARAIEVGNIFPLGTWYAEKMKAIFTDEDGKQKPFWFASYGIGTSRLVGAIAEVSHDKKGLVWPKSVAPFLIHLIRIGDSASVVIKTDRLYKKLIDADIDVLYDDRDASAGEKFAEADLIGIPRRMVISEKTLKEKSVEVKERLSGNIEMLKISELKF